MQMAVRVTVPPFFCIASHMAWIVDMRHNRVNISTDSRHKKESKE